MSDERLCKCGHNIHYHEDYDGDTHECTFTGCKCLQFIDVDDDQPPPQIDGPKE